MPAKAACIPCRADTKLPDFSVHSARALAGALRLFRNRRDESGHWPNTAPRCRPQDWREALPLDALWLPRNRQFRRGRLPGARKPTACRDLTGVRAEVLARLSGIPALAHKWSRDCCKQPQDAAKLEESLRNERRLQEDCLPLGRIAHERRGPAPLYPLNPIGRGHVRTQKPKAAWGEQSLPAPRRSARLGTR